MLDAHLILPGRDFHPLDRTSFSWRTRCCRTPNIAYFRLGGEAGASAAPPRAPIKRQSAPASLSPARGLGRSGFSAAAASTRGVTMVARKINGSNGAGFALSLTDGGLDEHDSKFERF